MIILTSACHDTYIAAVGILEKRNPHVLKRAQEAVRERHGRRGNCQLERATLPAPLGFVSVDKLLELVIGRRRKAVGRRSNTFRTVRAQDTYSSVRMVSSWYDFQFQPGFPSSS